MLPNLVCLEHHPKVRIAPGPDRSGLFCAQARSMRCVHTPVQRDQRRTTRPCDNPARTARSNLHLNRLSLRDFARAKRKLLLCSKAVRTAHAHGRDGAKPQFCCYFIVTHCYLRRSIAQSRTKWASPRQSHCFFIVINNGRTLDCTPSVRQGKTVAFRARATPPRSSAASRVAAASGRPTAA
jgi:hypothetical protein